MVADYALKRCLVTGASGFVGKVLCEKLQKNGVLVRALLRQDMPGPWDEVVLVDLNNFSEKSNEVFYGIDTVFYLSSIAHDKSKVASYDDFNVSLCLKFARSAIEHGIKRFIYVSSTKAMAELTENIADENLLDWPDEKYGLSKRKAEEGLLSLSGFEHLVIIRPCLIYGRGVKGNLLTMLNWIARGIFPPLPETKTKRSMVSVRDVATALVMAAKSSVAHRKVYLLSDNVDYSVKEIENAMRIALKKKQPKWAIPENLLKTAKLFPICSRVLQKLLGSARYSSKKIQRELGWHPAENFFEVLPEMVDEFISQRKPS